MKLETFFEKFDQFADAPDAVAKMRELVLDLAVQGKVADQDPSDEPAAELLKRLIQFKLSWCDQNRKGLCDQKWKRNALSEKCLGVTEGSRKLRALRRRIGLCGDAT